MALLRNKSRASRRWQIDHLRYWYNLYLRYWALPDVVVDDKALKGALEIMVQPVLLVADGKGVILSQRLFFAHSPARVCQALV